MDYHFSLTEKIIDFLVKRNIIRYSVPVIECRDGEDDFLEFEVTIEGENKKFYAKKDGLQAYELRATYIETFCDYRINGHAYIREETPVSEGDIVVDGGGMRRIFYKICTCQRCSQGYCF